MDVLPLIGADREDDKNRIVSRPRPESCPGSVGADRRKHFRVDGAGTSRSHLMAVLTQFDGQHLVWKAITAAFAAQ